MSVTTLTLAVGLVSLAAGLLGSLTGMGGGIVVVPVLTLLFGVDIHYAMGASLISVIATSSGAASAYVKEGFTNVRLGLFLEIATTLGAVLGAYLAVRVPGSAIGVVFGVVLLYSAAQMLRVRRHVEFSHSPDEIAVRLKLDGTLPTPHGPRRYHVQNVPAGFGLMFGAGSLSGLLGIGSGAFKVLAMDWAMRVPFKASTTTSNFMIGVTAAASAGVYMHRGYVDPGLAMPVMLGVLAGSLVGTRVLVRANVRALKLVFSLVVVVLAVEMIYNGLAGRV